MKINCILLIFVISWNLHSQIFQTINSGEWNDESIWLNGISPGLSCNDSIKIKHIVTYNDSLTFYKPVFIDTNGVLCGFEPIVLIHTKLDVFGTIRIGKLSANTSQVYMNNEHKSYISGMTIFGVGGWFKTGPNHKGVYFSTDFDCSRESLTTLFVFENELDKLLFYPNPVENKISVKGEILDFKLEIYSLTGKVIYQFENVFEIDLHDLHSGSYVLKIIQNGNKSSKSFKFIKL
jgi:hypothetical protein